MAKPMNLTVSIEEELARLDLKRQKQISNQVDAINRLLYEGSTYDNEMKVLHESLASCQEELDRTREDRDSLLREVEQLRGGKS